MRTILNKMAVLRNILAISLNLTASHTAGNLARQTR
jgi:hypothetical protein